MSVNIEALRFLIKLRYNVDFLPVKHYYERNGWKIIYFAETNKILEKFGLQEKAKTEKGFIYTVDNFKYIFIKKSLSDIEKRNVIFHEAGHIELNHKYSELDDEEIENQAKEFASVLIKHCGKNNRFSSIAVSIISVLIIGISIVIHHTASGDAALSTTSNTSIYYNQDAYTQHSVALDELQNGYESVFVTPSGHKYHLQNCFYIRYNNRAFEIDIETAKKSYSPCSYCMYDR